MCCTKWFIVVLCSCFAQESKDVKEQLMEIMRVQLMSVSPDDRESFTELCIKKRMECEEKQFSGRHAVFTWKSGTSTEAKDRFWRTYSCVYNQNINKCPVDGGWTEWSLWSKCKADCEDKGWQTRTRACENPKPAFGGNPCDGEKLENRTCIGLCSSNSDGLAEAEEYIVQIHNAFPDLAGLCMEKHCLYLEVMRIIKDRFKVDKYWSSINCVKYGSACPVNGGWGEWQEYTRCSARCGVGERFRSRKCDKPVTRNGGIPCQGEWFQETSCLGKNCSAKGVDMSDWSTFSPCSVSCGAYGVKESTKYCIRADKPCLVGGQKVEQITMAIPCYGGECPQTGGWGQWQPWTECSAECGVGRKTRFRQCDSPNPSGGESCLGIRLQTTACDGSMCIQVPKENENEEESQQRKRRSWQNFSSVTFGLSKDRDKLSLPLRISYYFNKSKVLLPSLESKLVQKLSIKFKTNLSTRKAKNISDSAGCLTTELPNKSLFRKEKLNESLEARSAVFPSTKTKECNPKESQPSFRNDGNISALNSTYLGAQTLRVSREVKVEQDDPYNFELNPDLENTYTTWTFWSACSASCGGGSRTRVRSCKDKTIVCRGEIKPTQFCNIDPCPVQGGWGAWGVWQPCSETCNKGFSERYRQCDSPLPAFGGTCPGTNKETKDCNLGICSSAQNPGYSWSLWTACSLSCNGGVRKREYRVSGASGRDYVDEQVKLCNPQPCPENGLWAAWGGWAPCTEACGLGNRVRDRTCTDPAPNWGGAPCEGEGSELQTCFAGPCLDEDDYGIKLEGNGFLTYSDIGKVTGLFMVFLRLKPASLNGTIFHHLEQWQDILVIVTESWAEMRVDDDYKEEKPFSPGNPHTFNFDGFKGKMGALRRNFKILLMFSTKSWSDHSVPIVIHNVKKIQMKASVRHPNFKGRFYSHLFFYETHFFHLTASFQITNTKGLLMFNGGLDPKSYISIALVDASLQFCLSCGSNATCNKGYEVKTDDWYILRVVVRENEGQLRLNDGDALQLMCPSGEKYRPRNNVYISGAGMKDWNIIVDVTSNKTMFHGIIDTLKVNGLIVTYKMATIIDVNGMLNSLGYSLSDYVTEVYKNEKTITTLYCGVPERTAKSHYVRIVWFENQRRMIPAAGVEISDVESDKQVVSKVNLYPEHAGEGIYACVLSQDGMLSVVHVFVVFRYKAYIGKRVKRRIGDKEEVDEYEDIEVMNHNNPEKVTSNYKVVHRKEESESHAEWIGLIILLVLILLCCFPALCYCCTKDHPMWIKVRNFFNRIYSYLTGQEYIEETELLAEEDYESEPAESESEGALGLDEDRSYDQLSSTDLRLKPEKMKPAKRSKSKGQKQSRPQSTQPKAQSETKMSQLGDEQEALPKKVPSKKQMKKPLKQAPSEDLPQTQSSNVIQQCPPGYHPQPCSPFYPISGAQQYYYPSSYQLTMNQPTTLQRPSYGPQPTTLQRPSFGPQPTLQRPLYGPQPTTLQRPSYGPLPLCGPSVSNIPPCRPSYNVLPPCRPPAFLPRGPSVSAYVPPQGPSQTSFTNYRQSPYSISPKGPSTSALSPHGASSSAFSPYKPQHQYSSTQPSITKLHISSPSMSPSRTGIHQSESRGRMYICRENNDDYQLQRRSQSQKVGKKFTCRESHLELENPNWKSDLENPNWQNDLSSYCRKQCDFVDQISVQIPPHRSFQAQSTYPETPCYQPHFPCRPSYNPYALYKPCNMNASIPPIDLVCNAYRATPFQTRRRESLSKDVNKNCRNRNNGIVEDQLNFSDNNSLNFHRSSVLASSTIYLQCDTSNLLW